MASDWPFARRMSIMRVAWSAKPSNSTPSTLQNTNDRRFKSMNMRTDQKKDERSAETREQKRRARRLKRSSTNRLSHSVLSQSWSTACGQQDKVRLAWHHRLIEQQCFNRFVCDVKNGRSVAHLIDRMKWRELAWSLSQRRRRRPKVSPCGDTSDARRVCGFVRRQLSSNDSENARISSTFTCLERIRNARAKSRA